MDNNINVQGIQGSKTDFIDNFKEFFFFHHSNKCVCVCMSLPLYLNMREREIYVCFVVFLFIHSFFKI